MREDESGDAEDSEEQAEGGNEGGTDAAEPEPLEEEDLDGDGGGGDGGDAGRKLLLGPEEEGVVADEEGDGEDEEVAPLAAAGEWLAGGEAVENEGEAGEEEADAGGEEGWDGMDDEADGKEGGSPEEIDGEIGGQALDGALLWMDCSEDTAGERAAAMGGLDTPLPDPRCSPLRSG